MNKLWNCSITRRDFVGKAAITAFRAAITTGGPGMMAMAANAEDAAAQPVVEVAQGRLLGSRIGRLYAFRGVPYAIADRFGPPQPVPAWAGIREAVRPGPICPQLPSRLEIIMGPPKQSRQMSEACQVLSIFSPDLNGKRPSWRGFMAAPMSQEAERRVGTTLPDWPTKEISSRLRSAIASVPLAISIPTSWGRRM